MWPEAQCETVTEARLHAVYSRLLVAHRIILSYEIKYLVIV